MKLPAKRNRLPRSFYDRSPEVVARQLLGKVLVRRILKEWVGGVIVETEAYLAQRDLASHSARGKTTSNAAMFGSPGTLYVYPIHAKYCMNAVTESEGRGSAVLIRSIEPIWGIEVMKANRGQDDLRRLTRGPAMLCQALLVNRDDDHKDLTSDPEMMIAEANEVSDVKIRATPRIGISQAQQLRLRFVVTDNIYVSSPKR
jgi:DNA-3-methyladenine glycosylase